MKSEDGILKTEDGRRKTEVGKKVAVTKDDNRHILTARSSYFCRQIKQTTMINKGIYFALAATVLVACGGEKEGEYTDGESGATKKSELHYASEKHLTNIKQLTFGADNAEAYFSFDNSKLVFQSNNEAWGIGCDQIFYFNYD